VECSGSGCSQGRGSAGGLWGAGSGGCGGCRMRRQKTRGFDGTGCSAFWGRVRVARKGVRARGMLHEPIVCLLAYVGLARISNSCSGKDCGCCLLRLLRHACLVSHHVAAPFQRRHNHRVGTPQTANAQSYACLSLLLSYGPAAGEAPGEEIIFDVCQDTVCFRIQRWLTSTDDGSGSIPTFARQPFFAD